MVVGKLLGSVIGKIVGPEAGKDVIAYFDTKQKLKQALALAKIEGKVATQKAKNELASQKVQNEHDWSMAQIANSGWKDEYVLVILSIPLVLAFCPVTSDDVLAGFVVLDQTPEWFRWLVVSVFAAIYGIKPAVNIWRKKTNAAADDV